MAVASSETFVYTELALPRWDATVPAAYPKGNRREVYLPFRVMCGVIGVERKRQLAIVRRDYGRVPDALKVLPLETPAGARPALWIRVGECALWIGNISPARTKLENRENLMQFQADLKEAAERLLFEGPRKPSSQRGMFSSSQRQEFVFSCLYCGGGHRIIAQNGEVTLERYEF